jgi:tetratricopeptide (TPR) repeat protein
MELVSFAAAVHGDAPGLLVLRFARPVGAAGVRALCDALAGEGVVALPVDPRTGEVAYPPAPLEVVGLRWLVPTAGDAERQRAALHAAGGRFGVERAWCFAADASLDSRRRDWRHGLPPMAFGAPFPVEGYPEILKEYDWYDFGIALKLGGAPLLGEEQLLCAFHRFWLAPYVDHAAPAGPDHDEDDDEDEGRPGLPYRHADVTYDAPRRAAVLWVDRFQPAPVDDLVHHLLWLAGRLHDVVPVVRARFSGVDVSARYQGLTGDPGAAVILAGNPFRELFRADGELVANAWAARQRDWDAREVAAMLTELVAEHCPDDPAQAEVAIRLAERAIALDPGQDDAPAYLVQLLVQTGRVDEAVARVSGRLDLGPHLVQVTAEHAPAHLEPVLAALPSGAGLMERLMTIAYGLGITPAGLAVYRHILALDPPAAGDRRVLYLRCLNNACVVAHGVGDLPAALELADRAQSVAPENPYLYHSAACAYAAAGDHERAYGQVELAVAHGYEHLDRLAVDADLGPILAWPRFKALLGAASS